MGEREAEGRGVPLGEDESGSRPVEPRRAVRDAVAAVTSDPDAIFRAALGRAGIATLPSRPDELTRFVSGALLTEIRRVLGIDAADVVRARLEPMVRALDALARPPKRSRVGSVSAPRASILVTRDEAVIAQLERRLDLRTTIVSGALALRSALVGTHPSGPPFVVIDGATEDAHAIAIAVPELDGIGALVWRAAREGVERWRSSPALGSRLLATTDASTSDLFERLRRAQSE